MRLRLRSLVLYSCCTAAWASAQAAGTVDVSFVNPSRFADAGMTARDEDANLRTISEHLRSLGERHLRAGQVLKIDVLDLDQAGEVRSSRQRGDVRISKGMADWPRISVRYSLQANGQVLSNGVETIGDLSYLQPSANYRNTEPLRHEKQMLDRWFKARFGEQRSDGD
jgi:hypothetical protein